MHRSYADADADADAHADEEGEVREGGGLGEDEEFIGSRGVRQGTRIGLWGHPGREMGGPISAGSWRQGKAQGGSRTCYGNWLWIQ